MPFTLDLPDILEHVTTVASGITGVRTAYDYDEWPDAPPAIHNAGQAVHLTGVPGEDGTGIGYTLGGPDLAIWTIRVPLYTVVSNSAARGRAWALPYITRYAEAYRAHIHLDGAITSGSVNFDEEMRVVRDLGDDWPGYAGFYILRHTLTVVSKGGVVNVL
jgi:hypothetical protein